MIDVVDKLPKIIAPMFEFRKNPKIFNLDGFDVYKYIDPKDMNNLIENLSRQVNLNWFDAILVNQMGGSYFANKLIKLQNYQGQIVDIKYHQNHTVDIRVPDELRNKKIGVVDDILDTGGTTRDILNDAHLATFIYLTQKVGVPEQYLPARHYSAVKISNVWVGGCCMNLDTPGDGLPKDFARSYEGLIAKIL